MQTTGAFSRGSRRFSKTLAALAALTLSLGLCASPRAQGQAAPTREPGNFDPQPGAPAVTGAAPTSGTRGQRAGRRGGAAGGARGPRVTAHSPRDDGNNWSPTKFDKADPKLPTLVVAGDSTASTGDPNHRGWAAVLIDYFDTSKVNIVNSAMGGTSFRTFYRNGEGPWKNVVDNLKPGDYVVIEFGHNDGDLKTRGDAPGIGDETVAVASANGTTETVHTFGWYCRKFVTDVKSKGAFPIVSSTTVRNMWSPDDKVERGMSHMLDWAKQVAEQEKVPFVDHSNVTADVYESMGFANVQKFFPSDHTHMSTDAAMLNAETFLAALKGLGDTPLAAFLNEKGKAIKAAPPKPAWVTYAPPADGRKGN